MWMTGAASDKLSAMLGPDDACCGKDGDNKGGCGKCVIVRNKAARHSDWTAVVMKKNRCPPWSHGCDKPHMDLAVPGYDNLKYSTANICGQSGTMISKQQSSICGTWYNKGGDTSEGCNCASLPSGTKEEKVLKQGCELFSSWGWTRGDPQLEYEPVECPPRFRELMKSAFGPQGAAPGSSWGGGGGGGGSSLRRRRSGGAGGRRPSPTPRPSPSPRPSPPPRANCAKAHSQNCAKAKCCSDPGMSCYEKDKWWAGCKLSCTPGRDPNDPPKYRTPWSCKKLG